MMALLSAKAGWKYMGRAYRGILPVHTQVAELAVHLLQLGRCVSHCSFLLRHLRISSESRYISKGRTRHKIRLT
jgi:hypothetical protein